jgi:hypothetical protein
LPFRALRSLREFREEVGDVGAEIGARAGSRMLALIPEVPLLENIGLGIALMSYDGKVSWGFTADYDLVPDLEHFVALIERSFAELAASAGVEISGSAGGGAEPLPAAEGTGR